MIRVYGISGVPYGLFQQHSRYILITLSHGRGKGSLHSLYMNFMMLQIPLKKHWQFDQVTGIPGEDMLLLFSGLEKLTGPLVS